jgi:hypothetical protein
VGNNYRDVVAAVADQEATALFWLKTSPNAGEGVHVAAELRDGHLL